MRLLLSLCTLLLLAQLPPQPCHAASPLVRIGSKQFTESVVIAEIVTGVAKHAGAMAIHRQELGGTRILWDALVKGEIDVYPEYTGTLTQEIFAEKSVADEEGLRQALAESGIVMTGSLGFSDNYAIGMKKETCDRLGITRISDLRRFPDLKLGFSNEFMERGDGWPGLRRRYGLSQRRVTGLQHDLAYRAVASGAVDATDLYSTDAEIAYYRLRTLTDDLHYFPEYKAILLYRKDLEKRAPKVVAALSTLSGKIGEPEMIRMNAQVKIERVPEGKVAADFLAAHPDLGQGAEPEGRGQRIWRRTKEHLVLVSLSLVAAIVIGVPLGIVAVQIPALGQLLLGFTAIVQTIPSLALLVFLIPFLGIGVAPTIVALFLYSLLPIVRNTHAGLRQIGQESLESAQALGLPSSVMLRWIELPMASRDILAGIKTSAVINVGTATLGALIGAGGYGQPILTGIRLDNIGLILEGAIPAAILALLVQGLFELAELVAVPKGLRLKRNS